MRTRSLILALFITVVCTAALAWDARTAMEINKQNYVASQGQPKKPLNTPFGRILYTVTTAGPGYVDVPHWGVVEIDRARYSGMLAAFRSGDPVRINDALLLVKGSAEMQGLIAMETSDGD